MKFIDVLQMVKGLGLTGVTKVIQIAVAVFLLKRKGEILPNLILLYIC